MPSLSGTISSVKLYLYCATLKETPTVNVHAITRTTWEADATWNTYDGTNAWTSAGGDYNATVIDATAITAATAWYSWVLMGTGSDNPLTLNWGDVVHLMPKLSNEGAVYEYATFSSAEAASNKPYLEITCVAPPVLTTQAVYLVRVNTLRGNGTITNIGGGNATRRGFCYKAGTSGDPTTADSVAYDDGDFAAEAYTKAITGLNVNTSYRVRAYAINADGTGYGTTVQTATASSIDCAVGTGVATGIDAALLKASMIVAVCANIIATGIDMIITLPKFTLTDKNTDSWSYENKNSASYDNPDKNTDAWTYEDKIY
jgi:hypothetical protein